MPNRAYRTRRSGAAILAAVFLLVTLGGCAQRQTPLSLPQYDPAGGYRFATRQASEDADDVFVVLAFSGGGLRATAMSYGVLEELRDTTVQLPGRASSSRLLDEVDLITSVSGGSFTAAYYGLFGERTFSDFETKVLRRNFTSKAITGALSPLSAPRLVSPTFGRSDLMAEEYSESVLDGRRYRDMCAGRPFVVLNAMNLQMGSLFYFTQDHFDFLGADLDGYPVGSALAASAAVPGALTPITLRNYPASPGFVPPAWSDPAPGGTGYPTRTSAHTVQSIRRYHTEKSTRPYLHITDSGFVDNTGLQYFIFDLHRGEIRRRLDAGRINTVLLILVNADNDRHPNIDCDPSSPGEITVVIESVFHAIGQVTRQTIALVETLIARTCSGMSGARPPPGGIHLVEVHLGNLRDPERRARLLDVPTSLELDADVVRPLVDSARVLLRENATFQRFQQQLAARTNAGVSSAPPTAGSTPPVDVVDPLAPAPAALAAPQAPPYEAREFEETGGLPAPVIRRVDGR